ncbi:MAG TPA: c-type cytochrome [Thermoanaerobaculia bacterium]|nr:c-type cytochrome [Thermoanaerobaculia bacterium]
MGLVLRRRVVVSAAFAILLAGTCAATLHALSSKVAWTLDTVRAVRAGDPIKGKKRNGDCVACHGENGIAETPEVPTLAGQDPLYTYKQLQDYKSKLRASPIMGEAVADLTDRDMADLAVFYAGQKPPAGKPAPPAASIAKLVSIGDGTRLIPACDSCHGARGAGNRGFYGMPALQNQKREELATEMKLFRSGERANDVYRVMRESAKKLTDAEIDALAAYYGSNK